MLQGVKQEAGSSPFPAVVTTPPSPTLTLLAGEGGLPCHTTDSAVTVAEDQLVSAATERSVFCSKVLLAYCRWCSLSLDIKLYFLV